MSVTDGQATFDLEQFRVAAPGRLEVQGTWEGVHGVDLDRSRLVLHVDDRVDQVAAENVRRTARTWHASFAWEGDPTTIREAVLEVGDRLAVELGLHPSKRRRLGRTTRPVLALVTHTPVVEDAELESNIVTMHAALVAAREQLAETVDELQAARQETLRTREDVERERTRRQHEAERHHDALDSVQRVAAEALSAERGRLHEQVAEVERMKEALSVSAAEAVSLQQQIEAAELESEQAAEEARSEIESARAELTQAQAEIETLRGRQAELSMLLSDARAEAERAAECRGQGGGAPGLARSRPAHRRGSFATRLRRRAPRSRNSSSSATRRRPRSGACRRSSSRRGSWLDAPRVSSSGRPRRCARPGSCATPFDGLEEALAEARQAGYRRGERAPRRCTTGSRRSARCLRTSDRDPVVSGGRRFAAAPLVLRRGEARQRRVIQQRSRRVRGQDSASSRQGARHGCDHGGDDRQQPRAPLMRVVRVRRHHVRELLAEQRQRETARRAPVVPLQRPGGDLHVRAVADERRQARGRAQELRRALGMSEQHAKALVAQMRHQRRHQPARLRERALEQHAACSIPERPGAARPGPRSAARSGASSPPTITSQRDPLPLSARRSAATRPASSPR